MIRMPATAILTLFLLASGTALAQTEGASQQPQRETDSTAATNALIPDQDDPGTTDVEPPGTEDAAVGTGDEAGEHDGRTQETGVSPPQGNRTDSFGQMPVPSDQRRQPDPSEQGRDPARAVRSADPNAETSQQDPRMFPGQIAPDNVGPTGSGRASADELTEYTVHLADAEKFGKVEGLIINLETGAVEQLVVSTGGGILGMGSARYEIPFDQVAAINTGTKEMRVAVSRNQIELPGDTAESANRAE